MLWCENYCYLHYPKTAGKSLSRFFLQSWNAPVYGYVSKGQIKELEDYIPAGSDIKVGRGHENLKEAELILNDHGLSVHELKAVFVGTRNPYDLMVSNYHFMRETFKHNQDKRNFIIAHNSDFDTFCENVGVATPKNWMEIDGKPLANLERVRFEHLTADLEVFTGRYDFNKTNIDHLNASSRGHYSQYMSSRSEAAIHRKFRYYFNKKFYQRERFEAVTDSVDIAQQRVG